MGHCELCHGFKHGGEGIYILIRKGPWGGNSEWARSRDANEQQILFFMGGSGMNLGCCAGYGCGEFAFYTHIRLQYRAIAIKLRANRNAKFTSLEESGVSSQSPFLPDLLLYKASLSQALTYLVFIVTVCQPGGFCEILSVRHTGAPKWCRSAV